MIALKCTECPTTYDSEIHAVCPMCFPIGEEAKPYDHGEPMCGCNWCERLEDGVHLHQILEGFVVSQHREIGRTNEEMSKIKEENYMLRNLLKTIL